MAALLPLIVEPGMTPAIANLRPALRVLLLGLVLQVGAASGATVTISANTDPDLLYQIAPARDLELRVSTTAEQTGARWQWYFDDLPVPGATAPTLTRPAVMAADSGNYQVSVTDDSGAVSWSEPLTINVVAPPPSALDRSFSSQLPADVTAVERIAVAPDGSVFATCSTAGGSTRVEHLLADGRLDPAFSFPPSSGSILATLTDGGLVTTTAPYRLGPSGAAAVFALPTGFDPGQPLSAAAAQSDGKFLVAQQDRIVRFTADGVVDSSFRFSSDSTAVISWMAVDFAGRVVIRRTGSAMPVQRLLASGETDPTFSAPPPIDTEYAPMLATSLPPLRQGGYCGIYGSASEVVRLRDDGTRDPAWGTLVLVPFEPRSYGIFIAADPDGQVFVAGRLGFSRYVSVDGVPSRDPTFYHGTPTGAGGGSPEAPVSAIAANGAHDLFVAGSFAAWDGSPTRHVARLHSDAAAHPAPLPAISSFYRWKNGGSVELRCTGIDDATAAYAWLALDHQPMPADTSSSHLTLEPFSSDQYGRYQVRVTTSAGVVLSQIFTAGPGTEPAYLANISCRAAVRDGNDRLIVGIVTENGGRELVRGVGPSLATFGLQGYVTSPQLHFYDRTGAVLDTSGPSNTPATAAALARTLGAFPLLPGAADDAQVVTLRGGITTIDLSTAGPGAPGVGLIEVYPESSAVGVVNLSVRALAAPGEATAIAGFVLVDPVGVGRTARLLLRAIGPTLASQGVAHPLADPVLTLYTASDEMKAVNDNWAAGSQAATTYLAGVMQQVGAFALPADSRDAALLLDLPAGAYTMHATGGEGVVLLEIYLVR